MKKNLLFVLLFVGIAFAADAQVQKKVLVEKYTSAQCGNCPDGAAILKNITDTVPEVIWVSVHAGWIPDVMGFPTLDTTAMAFTSGAPKASIDRTKFSNESEVATFRQNWANHITTQKNKMANVSVELTGSYDPNTRDVDITVTANFATMPASGDYRINLYIVEDNVVGSGSSYNQSNYFNNTQGHAFFGLGNPVVGYAHRHVLRDVLTNAWGFGGVIPNAPAVGVDYNRTFSYTVPAGYDHNETRLVAFVTEHNSDVNQRSILNANEKDVLDLQLPVSTKSILLENTEMTVVPNPVRDDVNLRITTDKTLDAQILIYNIAGQQVTNIQNVQLSEGQNVVSLTIGDLPNGSYFVNMQTTEGNVVTKMMIAR